MKTGSVYSVAVSHGEGKFVASEEVLNKLIENVPSEFSIYSDI